MRIDTRAMHHKLLALLLALAGAVALAACGDDDTTATTAPAEEAEDVTTSSAEPDDSTDAGDTPSGDLELPEGAVLVARLTTEEDGETSTIVSESEGSCAFGFLTPGAYNLSFSIIEGADNSGLESIEGPDVDGFSIEVAEGESVGEVGWSRADVNDFDYEHKDEEAEITVTEEGDAVRFVFEGVNEDGVAFSGEALCGSVVEG
jgi:hypothetical protein